MSQNNQSMFLNLMTTAVQKESKVEPLLMNIFSEISEGNRKKSTLEQAVEQAISISEKKEAIKKTDPLSDLLGIATKKVADPLSIKGITSPTKPGQLPIGSKNLGASIISNVFANIKKGVSGVAKAGAGLGKFLGQAELKLFVGGFKLMGKAMKPFGKVMGLMSKAAFGPFGDIMDLFSDLGEILGIGFVPIIVDIQKIILELQPTMLMIAGWITEIYNALKGFLSGDLSAGAVTDILSEILTTVLDMLEEFLPMLVDVLVENIPLIIDIIFELIPMIIEVIVDAIPLLIDVIINIFILLVNIVTENIPLLVKIAIQTIIMVVEALTDALPLIIVAIVDAIPLIIDALMSALPMILDFVMLELPALAWSALSIAFTTLMDVVPGMLLDVGTSIIDGVVVGIQRSLSNVGESITESPVFQAIEDVWETIEGWFD